jgi:ketosteroid isomerase-like protein
MSQENVELVRRGMEALGRNDWDVLLAAWDPGIEWVEMPSLGPDASTYVGVEPVREAVQSWIRMWSDYELEAVRYLDVANDVVVLSREHGSGGASGVTVRRELGQIFTFANAKVVRVCLYGSWSEALDAVGVSD